MDEQFEENKRRALSPREKYEQRAAERAAQPLSSERSPERREREPRPTQNNQARYREDSPQTLRRAAAPQQDASSRSARQVDPRVSSVETRTNSSAPRPRRSASGDNSPAPRPRRNASNENGPAPRPRRGDSNDNSPAPRPRRNASNENGPAPRPRRSTDDSAQTPRARRNATSAEPATHTSDKSVDKPLDEFAIESLPEEHRPQVATFRKWTVRAFAGILALGLVVGLLFFARPTTSTLENRDLTPFPQFTIEGALDGSFFSNVSKWYADTYPIRETLVGMDKWLEGFFGLQTNTMMIGGKSSSDVPETSEAEDTSVADAAAASQKKVDPPTQEAMSEEIQDSIMNGLYIENGAAYSLYYFYQPGVETYASALNLAAERLDGQTRVFSIIAPNNSGVMLSESTLQELGGTDQQKAINYFNSLYSSKVTPIETINTLREHNSEYLYFRTDHHWTTLASYYVYQNLCEQLGETPHELSEYQSIIFQPFLGSFYNQLELDAMAANPDYVEAYYPIGTNDMTYWNSDGEEVEYHVITDVSDWNEASLYNTFIGGDQPLCKIVNPTIDDGSSCVLVKDSFGCAFAPFLVDLFQTVYIIDFRYYSGNIVDFCQENEVQNLIFLNNLSMASTETVSNAILSEVQESES